MLLSTNEITGYSLHAKDGQIGEVTSLLFDDRDWNVRYVAARTMRWLGREVLLAPESFGTPDWKTHAIPVDLTKDQIKESPSIRLDAPVSRRQLVRLHAHYGWSTWWGAADRMLDMPASVAVAEAEREASRGDDGGDPNLRSTGALVNLRIEVRDGEIGHVEDFIVDTKSWKIRYLIVDTKNWLPGKKVYVLPEHVREIDWSQNVVALDLDRKQVEQGAEFDPRLPINREVETRLLDFYGRPYYWV